MPVAPQLTGPGAALPHTSRPVVARTVKASRVSPRNLLAGVGGRASRVAKRRLSHVLQTEGRLR